MDTNKSPKPDSEHIFEIDGISENCTLNKWLNKENSKNSSSRVKKASTLASVRPKHDYKNKDDQSTFSVLRPSGSEILSVLIQ